MVRIYFKHKMVEMWKFSSKGPNHGFECCKNCIEDASDMGLVAFNETSMTAMSSQSSSATLNASLVSVGMKGERRRESHLNPSFERTEATRNYMSVWALWPLILFGKAHYILQRLLLIVHVLWMRSELPRSFEYDNFSAWFEMTELSKNALTSAFNSRAFG